MHACVDAGVSHSWAFFGKPKGRSFGASQAHACWAPGPMMRGSATSARSLLGSGGNPDHLRRGRPRNVTLLDLKKCESSLVRRAQPSKAEAQFETCFLSMNVRGLQLARAAIY
jgi:hypothetical protein